MIKKKKYTRNVNIKLTEEEFNSLQVIRDKYKKTVSKMFRESIQFYELYYKESEN